VKIEACAATVDVPARVGRSHSKGPADHSPADRIGARPTLSAAIGWGIVAAVMTAAMAPLEPNLLEEGYLLHFAQRMLAGERLFTDLASFTGPLPFHLLAGLFRFSGEDVAVARGTIVVGSGLSTAAIVALAERADVGTWRHAVGAILAASPVLLFPFHSIYFYSTIAYQLSLIAAWAAAKGLASRRWAFAAGLLIAAVALSKQTVGLALALCLVPAFHATAAPERRRRVVASLLLGGLAATLSTLLVHGLRGELGALVQSLVLWPLGFDVAFDAPFPDLWPPGQLSPALLSQAHFYTPFVYSILRGAVLEAPSWAMTATTQALFALPFLSLAATLVARWRGPLPPAIWIHGALLLALMSNLVPRTDWGHLVFVVAPAVVQGLLLGSRIRPIAGHSPGGRALASTIAVALIASSAVVGARLWLASERAEIGPRLSLRPLSDRTRDPALGRVVSFLRENVEPDEPIFVARAEPLIYFATGLRNPTPYAGIVPGFFDEQQATILDALEGVRWVVMSEIDQPVFTYYRDLLPGVQAQLERHFRIADPFEGEGYGWLVVLERRPDRGPTEIDLFEAQPGARRWQRDARGELRPVERPLPRLATSHHRRPLPLSLGPSGGGIDFEIELPEHALFQAEVGLERIYGVPTPHPRNVRFELSIGRDGVFEPVASLRALAGPDQGDRWLPIEADLSAWAGQQVVLRLSIETSRHLRTTRLGWWGSPRIATRPPDAPPPRPAASDT